jgi:hypothetical protein
LQVEEPISGWDGSSFDFHPTLAGMLRPTLIRDWVVQACKPREKRLLASLGMMKALHCEQLPLDGIMRLIKQGAGHGHLRVCEHRVPACLLVLKPAPRPLAIGRPRRGGDVIGKVTQPLAERKHPQALALTRTVQEGMELRV